MPLTLSSLYPVLDASYLPGLMQTDEHAKRLTLTYASVSGQDARLPGDEERRRFLEHVVRSLAGSGVTMLQYRNKHDPDLQVLRDATWLRRQAPTSMRIILNDRVHLVKASGCDGVHVGQSDWSPADVRAALGADCIVGLSTHNDDQIRLGDQSTADYLAIGPVFATGSKADAEAPVGLDGIRKARALTRKPLVAIGGINLARARDVCSAGADSLAVISALFQPQPGDSSSQRGDLLAKLAGDFLEVFR